MPYVGAADKRRWQPATPAQRRFEPARGRYTEIDSSADMGTPELRSRCRKTLGGA